MKRWALAAVPLVVLVVLALGPFGEPAGGGGGGGGGSPSPTASVLPYPPRAAEPGRAPKPTRPPAGRVVPIGGPVEGLTDVDPRSGLLAVALKESKQLVLFDVGAGSVRRSVPLPAAPRHLELAKPGGPVLVPAEEADMLVQVPLPDGEPTSTKVGDFPHDAAFQSGRAYTADEFASTVSEVEDGRVTQQVPVDVQPGAILPVGDDLLGVVSVRAYTFTLFDPENLRSLGSQWAGLGPTHAVADGDGRVYVTDTRGDALIVFASRPNLKWLARIPLSGAPYGIAVDERRGRVWVALSATNELVEIIAGDKPRRGRTLPTIRQPNSVGVDESTGVVAVGSGTDDGLQLVDP